MVETEFVKYVNLPSQMYTGDLDIQCAKSIVMGWGVKKEGNTFHNVELQCAYVKVLKQVDCKWDIATFPETIICASPITGVTCSVSISSSIFNYSLRNNYAIIDSTNTFITL